MKNQLVKQLLVLVIVFFVSGCSTQMGISNGGYSDISLTRESKDYKVKRLKEVNSVGKSLFGIPIGSQLSNKKAIIVRFNGINLNTVGGFWPFLSMVGLTLGTGYAINELGGHKKESMPGYTIAVETNKPLFGFGLSCLMALPIAGAINSAIWYNVPLSRAAYNANSKLLNDNPNVDFFLNPKYEVERINSLWLNEVRIKAKVMGATIIEDDNL